MELEQEQIEKYFVTSDMAILLYSIYVSGINDKVTDQQNIVLFHFDDYKKFIDWLENGGDQVKPEVSLTTLTGIINYVPEQHKPTMMVSAAGPNRICLVIVCNCAKIEIWCSVTTVNKVTNLSIFDEVRSKYPKHLKMKQ